MGNKISLFLIICLIVMSISACGPRQQESSVGLTDAPSKEIVLEDIKISTIGEDGANTLTYDTAKWQPATGKTGEFDYPMLQHLTISGCVISPWLVEYPDTTVAEESITLGSMKYKYASIVVDEIRYDKYVPDVKISGIIPTLAVVLPAAEQEGCSSDAQVVLATLH